MKNTTLTTLIVCATIFTISCNNIAQNENKLSIEKPNDTIKNVTADTSTTETSKVLKGDYCFLKADNKDTLTIKIRILSDDDIRGEMIWSPWQKDGAVGTLTGKMISKNEMKLNYDYTIEGNRQSEEKIMKIANEKLFIKKGELKDPKNDGHLVLKDTSKAIYNEVLNKIICE